MKKITAGITVIAFVALCAVVRPQNAEVGDLPAEPVKAAVNVETEDRAEKISEILLSDNNVTSETEVITESKLLEVTAEEKTETAQPIEPISNILSKPPPTSTQSKSGDILVIVGKPFIWIPGFGWIEEQSGEGGGAFAADMYENGHKIGIMGGDKSTPYEITPPPSEQPESGGDVIYIELQPPVAKNSTPPPYKPNGDLTNP
jgi:hypothetical protein